MGVNRELDGSIDVDRPCRRAVVSGWALPCTLSSARIQLSPFDIGIGEPMPGVYLSRQGGICCGAGPLYSSVSPLAPMLVYSVDLARQRKIILLDLSGFPTS